MASDFAVQNRTQVIVPLRFARAVSGAPKIDAPDLDHRGWHNPHFSPWTDVAVRGACVCALNGETIRIKLVREHLDSSAPVYVIPRVPSGAGSQIKITSPRADQHVDASGVFHVQGTAISPDPGSGNIVEARLGAPNGPLLAECEVRVVSPARLFVAPHVCTIHTTAGPPGDGRQPDIDVDAVFSIVKAIWRQAGVEIIADAAVPHDVFNAPFRDSIEFADNGPGQADWLTNGRYVSTAPGRVNVYFVRYSRQSAMVGTPLGRASHRGNMARRRLTRPAVFVAVRGTADGANNATYRRISTGADLDQELGNDTAHEIGHFLTLSHFGAVNNPGRDDTYARQNLMHPNNLLPDPKGTNNVHMKDCGYGRVGGGSGHRGCMLTIKQHNLFLAGAADDSTFQFTSRDAQVANVRMQIFSSPGRPFPGLSLY